MPTGAERPYPDVPASPRFPDIEVGILDSWAKDATFAASVDSRPTGARGANEFVFYDGPPFANGLPHYGHLLTGYVKDVIPRYQTMRGRHVERRFGWDCHGLPAEVAAEKELGVSGRGPITEYGIDRFNDHCRSSVLRYTHEWESYVTRQARWVDFDNDYKTLDLPYMESVMWAFKQLWEKGLLYEAYRVLPYCWECETPLSNSETRQDDAYRPRQDPAVTVEFTVLADPTAGDILGGPLALWVWTTTPWTLPSNLAVAVGPDIDYAVFDLDGRRVVIGAGTIAGYEKQLEGAVPVATVTGADLVGRRYQPLFDYFADRPNAFKVLAAAFVSTDDGTGIVHMAPGFGEDDQILCAAAGIDVVCPVDARTRFTAEVPDYEGLQVFEANQPVIRALRDHGQLVRADSYVHSYPHCWRTDTPLVYKAVTSWFVQVTAIKDRLVANNQEITWVPAHVKDGSFGKWLEGARDWSISRNRFWGSPIPVWKSDDPAYPRLDVYGSLDELEADFGVRPADLHRPGIDDLTRPNPDDPSGRSTMRRVTDVLDCWFESGSMPFAQVHYPFENQEWFENHFPGDFIVEYINQTRGWFYTLHVMATALFDRPAFRTAVAHGVILGADGQKMSKRLRNYPDPEAMFAAHGADAMRWYLMSSAILRGGDTIADEKGITASVRAALLPLWNAWYFFSLYANADQRAANIGRTDAPGVLDRYILAKLQTLVESVGAAMDSYDISGACSAIEGFLDALTNWYIRRGRDRFWGTSPSGAPATPGASSSPGAPGSPDAPGSQGAPGSPGADTQAAFDTLGTVLELLCRVAAPLLPLETEAIWRGLTGGTSVHLTDWPDATLLPADPGLVTVMDRVRDVCSAAHSVRKAQSLRARLPLASLTIAATDVEAFEPYRGLIADELNVHQVHLTTAVDDYARRQLTVNFKVAAPRLGADTPAVAAAAKRGDWSLRADGRALVGDAVLEPTEFDMKLDVEAEATTRALSDATLVIVDITMSPELLAEGMARDVVRLVQQARRSQGFDVSDRIHLALSAAPAVLSGLDDHVDWIGAQTLAVEVTLTSSDDTGAETTEPSAGGWESSDLPGGASIRLKIRRR